MRTALTLCAGILAAASAASADGITVTDAYARASSPKAKSGAAFLVLTNTSTTPDRLLSARSDAAKRVELHSHVSSADGMMQMLHDEDGFEIPAMGSFALARGGDHVMLMGLTAPFDAVATIDLTLVFEQAGEMVVTVPVDLSR